jgi:hypothetical protein
MTQLVASKAMSGGLAGGGHGDALSTSIEQLAQPIFQDRILWTLGAAA